MMTKKATVVADVKGGLRCDHDQTFSRQEMPEVGVVYVLSDSFADQMLSD